MTMADQIEFEDSNYAIVGALDPEVEEDEVKEDEMEDAKNDYYIILI